MSSIFKQLKEQYFDWKTWRYLYKSMSKNTYKQIDLLQVPYLNKPGITFSIDDSFRVKDWYTYGKDLFGYYDVPVTFNVNAFHHYEDAREHAQSEIDMLIDLQANGHEIAHHGFNHKNAVEYTNKVGKTRWIEDEILPLFEWLDKQIHSETGERFKRPVTFAFPHFQYNESILAEIVPNYFKVARGHFKGDNLTSFGHTGFAPSICIDSHYLKHAKNVNKMIRFIKQTGANLIFTCHSILPEDMNWDDLGWEMTDHEKRWRVSPKVIAHIIEEAKRNDLAFYTTAELGGIATFIDRNFEVYMRSLLSKGPDQWIFIDELYSIKSLDLSNQQIANLDGIQYFLSLESLDIRNNHIKDLRLLKKMTQLTDVNI